MVVSGEVSVSSAYQVRVADDSYWREQIKCQFACPVRTDATLHA